MNWLKRSLMTTALTAIGVLTCLGPAIAGGGLIDQLTALGQQSGAAAATATSNAATSTKLTLFTAAGAVTESLNNGACAGSYAAATSYCMAATSNCAQIQITGPVSAKSLGASTFTGCFTVDNTSYDVNLDVCFAGLGTATITSNSGKKSITVAMGGSICVADVFPLPTPTSEYLNTNAAYVVESGTGSLSGATGTGEISVSFLAVNPTTTPIPGTGQVNMNGNLGK